MKHVLHGLFAGAALVYAYQAFAQNTTLTAELNTRGIATRPFSVTRYGAKCDGVTDDTASIQAAENAAAAAPNGGMVTVPRGRCKISSQILWDSNVGLSGVSRDESALFWASGVQMNGPMVGCRGFPTAGTCTETANAPIINVKMYDIELDASGAAVASYNVGYKGVFFQHMDRPLFERLYIHDCPATCLGVDFLRGGIIRDNVIVNGGRAGNNSTSLGASNIGIGAGNDPSEGGIVSGNYVSNGMRYGIFLESQNVSAVSTARWAITGNFVYNTADYGEGIGDAGMQYTTIVGNNVYIPASANVARYAIAVDAGTVGTIESSGGVIANNYVTGGSSGIGLRFLFAAARSVSFNISGNIVRGANFSCISVSANGGNISGVKITGNTTKLCGSAGILLSTSNGVALNNVQISDNQLINSGTTTATTYAKSGLALNGILNNLTVRNNMMYDDQATKTQQYAVGINTGSTITGLLASGNAMSGNGTAPFLLGSAPTASEISNNNGYNPVGPTTLTVGASPWTYTAGSSPESLCLSGGTVSAVTKGGVTVASASNSCIPMAPNSSAVVTYSAAPAAVADR
jgi:hypothetical protein